MFGIFKDVGMTNRVIGVFKLAGFTKEERQPLLDCMTKTDLHKLIIEIDVPQKLKAMIVSHVIIMIVFSDDSAASFSYRNEINMVNQGLIHHLKMSTDMERKRALWFLSDTLTIAFNENITVDELTADYGL